MKNNSAAWIRIAFLATLSSSTSASPVGPDGLNHAQTLFEQRCASAGEKIARTVSDVDGVLLLKLRTGELNYRQQFRLNDPYGRDYHGEGYIKSFLRAHHELTGRIARMRDRPGKTRDQLGYSYVEAVDPEDGKRYHYTAFVDQPGMSDVRYAKDYLRVVLESTLASGPSPRYGVTYDDISTSEDRLNWIAGSSLKVIDLLTNEVIAERIGYMMDPAQGADGGGRSPWLIAASHACPAFSGPRPASSQEGKPIGLSRRFYCHVRDLSEQVWAISRTGECLPHSMHVRGLPNLLSGPSIRCLA